MRRVCLRQSLPFTTSFHTRFPDYLADRLPVPERWTSAATWAWLRRFHAPGAAVLAATPTLASELTTRGFENVKLWPRGVDAGLFHPRASVNFNLPRPIFLTVGRLAVEKNLEAFLTLDLPGTKLVVGDGPARNTLARKFPEAVFIGSRHGEALAEAMLLQTSLCFQAAPTRSGSCFWRHWRAACRLLRFPLRRHAT
jgi:glycosyltransferase involved in cell wall biosynthesis